MQMLPIIGRTSVAVLRDSHILMKTERKVITLRQGDAVVGIELSIEIVLIDITYKPAALKEVTVVFVVGIIAIEDSVKVVARSYLLLKVSV